MNTNYNELNAIERRELIAQIDHAMRVDNNIYSYVLDLLETAKLKGHFEGVKFNSVPCENKIEIEQDYPDFVNSDIV